MTKYLVKSLHEMPVCLSMVQKSLIIIKTLLFIIKKSFKKDIYRDSMYCTITIYYYYLFLQLRLLWHQLSHFNFALKHLHLFVIHYLLLLHIHLTKLCPPLAELLSASRRDRHLSWLMSCVVSRICGHKSNSFFEYIFLRIPLLTAILCKSFSLRSTMPRSYRDPPYPCLRLESESQHYLQLLQLLGPHDCVLPIVLPVTPRNL